MILKSPPKNGIHFLYASDLPFIEMMLMAIFPEEFFFMSCAVTPALKEQDDRIESRIGKMDD